MSNKTKKSLKYLSPSLLVLLFAAFLGLYSAIVRQSSKLDSEADAKAGNQLAYRETLAKSLNLNISSKALYPGGNLQKISDLGVIEQSHHYVVRFPVTNDNLKEYALMTVPTSPMPKQGYPLLILCHGYVSPSLYSTTSHYVSDMEFYSRHGFVVIKPDFRGQGLSRDAGRAEGAYFSMAYNTDLMNLISSAKKAEYINKDSISLWGHSMGAYIALRASIMADIKNVIVLSGVVGNARDMYATFVAPSDTSNPPAAAIRQKMLIKHGSSLTNPDYWYSVTPANFLKGSKTYYQIYVGSKDQTVPPIFSEHLNQTLSELSLPHFYRAFPQGDHGLVGERPIIWADSLKYLRQRPV